MTFRARSQAFAARFVFKVCQMPILSNPRWERFAQELAKSKTAAEAYIAAGYKKSRKNASRLKTNEDILARMAELQARASEGLNVTLQWLIEKAEEARALAMSNGQASAAVMAVKELGVLSGKRIERSEHGEPGEFDRMSDEELANYIARESGEIGKTVN